MREEGLVAKGMPLALSLSDTNWYKQPDRFYWAGDDTTTQAMMYGPIAHNDNLSRYR